MKTALTLVLDLSGFDSQAALPIKYIDTKQHCIATNNEADLPLTRSRDRNGLLNPGFYETCYFIELETSESLYCKHYLFAGKNSSGFDAKTVKDQLRRRSWALNSNAREPSERAFFAQSLDDK